MKNFAHRIALLGLGLAAITLAAALGLGFIELLSHVNLGHLGTDAPSSSMTVQDGSTQAILVNSLGVFEMIAHWVVALASVVGVLVLPMAGLVLIGVGSVCLHGSVAGLPRPSVETSSQKEPASSAGRYADAEPVLGLSALLRKLNPALLS